MRFRKFALATALLVGGAGALASNAAGAVTPAAPGAAPGGNLTRACDTRPAPGHATCQAIRRSDIPGHRGLRAASTPSGYGPADIKSAYNLPTGGDGVTVAIVDAYDDPNAESDLATYRQQYNLPACTTDNGCFKKTDQRGGAGYPKGDKNWAGEIALDLDAVSAACPACHILLVESDDNQNDNMYAAVNQAVKLGARFVSNSWSSGEDSSQTGADENYFNHPGVVLAFATGDNGYADGTQYPASSKYTLAVGGTTLNRSGGTSRGWSESAWKGAGSGCSAYESTPSWQSNLRTGCGKRATSDLSAVADPQTGLAVYNTYQADGWGVWGGTSLATPLVTAMYALAGTPGDKDYPAAYPYAHTDQLNDVASGNNGTCGAPLCSAGSGWDGPTGLGTPNGVGALKPGGTTPPPGGSVTVTNPGDQWGFAGFQISPLQIKAGASDSGSLTFSATGLPNGLAISSSGSITGTPSTGGTYHVTVTAKEANGTSGSTSFTWAIYG